MSFLLGHRARDGSPHRDRLDVFDLGWGVTRRHRRVDAQRGGGGAASGHVFVDGEVLRVLAKGVGERGGCEVEAGRAARVSGGARVGEARRLARAPSSRTPEKRVVTRKTSRGESHEFMLRKAKPKKP